MIRNTRTNEILARNEITCKNILTQARGLMFRKKAACLLQFKKERKISLHNCFVFFPIQVLILNSQQEVVEIKNNFKPFSFYTAKFKGKYVLELPIHKNVKVGDHIDLHSI